MAIYLVYLKNMKKPMECSSPIQYIAEVTINCALGKVKVYTIPSKPGNTQTNLTLGGHSMKPDL